MVVMMHVGFIIGISKRLREIGSPGGNSKKAHTSFGIGPNIEVFVGHVTTTKNNK